MLVRQMKHKTTTMKKFILVFLLGFLCSCKAQKPLSETSPILSSECPTDGTCEIEILKNKQLLLLYDDFGGMYYDLKDHEGTTVIHYQYNKTTQANLQDGHYREDLIFEIKNSDKSLKLSDLALQETKLIFGRQCFCRGETGYFKVEKGSLLLENTKEGQQLQVEFTVGKIPQLITQIKAKFN